MELRQLEYVVAVVDHGTFRAAAAAVHVTQPSLSQGVRALERELGVDLFHRVGRRAVLSAAGAALVGPGRQALRDAATAAEAARSVLGLRSGRLDIATLPTLAVDPLAPLIGTLRADHPGLRVVVTEPETAAGVAELVRDGTCEIGLAELPPPAHLEAMAVTDQDLVAVAPSALGLPADRPVPLRRLARHPLVSTPPGTSTRDLVDDAFRAVGAEPVIAVETTHREALAALAAAGAGITFLPRPLAERVAGPSTTIVTTTPRLRRRVGIVHRPGSMSPAARVFIEVARGRP
jgi:DNA-binding transcriptional LysR family regulator